MKSETINSDMIILAREYRDYTQEELARRIHTSQATIAKIEGGFVNDISETTIELLSSALKFPKSFFYQDEQRIGFGSSSYFYRKKSKISASDRRRITSIVNLNRITIKNLLSPIEIDAARELPYFDIEDHNGDASKVARRLRAAWDLPDGPIKNVTSLMESAGVLVIPCDFGTNNMDATSINMSDMPPMVFINKNMPGDRWRFTLCHELGHLVMHQVARETMENEADEFASEFLMPESEIKPQFNRISKIRIQDLANMKPYWKVSIAALIMRAKNIGAITHSQSKYFWMQMSKLGYRKVEPAQLHKEKIQNYLALFDYYRNGMNFSDEDIAKLSVIYRQELPVLHGAFFQPEKKSHLRAV